MNLLQSIQVVKFSFPRKIARISTATVIAMMTPCDLRITFGESIGKNYFLLLDWRENLFEQNMDPARNSAKAWVRTIKIATIFSQVVGIPAKLANDNHNPSGKVVYTAWADKIAAPVQWALLKVGSP